MEKIKLKLKHVVNIFFAGIALFLIIYSCEGTTDSSGTGKGGSMARFAASGDFLYVVTNNDLKVFDISQESTPSFDHDVSVGWNIETIFSQGNKLYLGSQNGMYIYDISDAGDPMYISFYSHIVSCDPVVVSGNYAYVTLNTENVQCGRNVNELQIIDISNVYSPDEIASYDMISPKGLGVDDDLLFVCDAGLKVYDISDVYNIELLYEYHISAYDVIPDDGLLILIGTTGLYQFSYDENEVNLLSTILINN